ncbi:MAG: Fic family protein [Alphaproteobacteria bacterium]|nr:Fic family protein [Alphaproteobacteria bacterium]
MEPMLISESSGRRGPLADLALEVAQKSARLGAGLPAGVALALADLVRAMNCYYSNLIEGRDTHPIDIERALRADFSKDPEKRDLQLEAKAHIATQEWIDAGGLDGRATTSEGLRETHERFCKLLPEDLLWAKGLQDDERIKVIPGVFREHYVKVGDHIAISPGAVPRFMKRFEEAYRKLGKVDAIIAAATAHHRFAWIHPFIDGNGRVGRLMSYAMLREALDTGGIWSIARGLARSEEEYKRHLAACDLPRRNDLDGRGTLSEEALASFARYFLTTCLDQINFMESLVQPDELRGRMLIWAEEEVKADRLPPKTGQLLEAILYRGELPKGDVETLLGVSTRTARRLYSALIERGVVTSQSKQAPLRLAFPAGLASRWMPGLFPDKKDKD